MRKKNGHPEPFNVKFWSVGNEKGGKGYIDKVRDTAQSDEKGRPEYPGDMLGVPRATRPYRPVSVPDGGTVPGPPVGARILDPKLSATPNARLPRLPDALRKAGCPHQRRRPIDRQMPKCKTRSRSPLMNGTCVPGTIRDFPGHQARKVDYQNPEIIALIKDRDKMP